MHQLAVVRMDVRSTQDSGGLDDVMSCKGKGCLACGQGRRDRAERRRLSYNLEQVGQLND